MPLEGVVDQLRQHAVFNKQSSCEYITVEGFAIESLYQELACFPKPGLVSFVDSGSHDDMDAGLFLRSICSLRGYFASMARMGAEEASFNRLNARGRSAELSMFTATGGRNTHRGAIFTLGLLAAASGHSIARKTYLAEHVCYSVRDLWGGDIAAVAELDSQASSHGAIVRNRYRVTGAREEAASGFPTVLNHALRAYRSARGRGADRNACAVEALFAIIAVLPDNNLLHRGGLEGLLLAQDLAKSFLSEGGIMAPGGYARAVHIHRRFVRSRLSPGGAADLLAATIFLDAIEAWGNQL